MVENELIVRLVECAKPLDSVYDGTTLVTTGWADTTSIPKKGEICLEYYTNTDTSSENYGKVCYRMKIGDGVTHYKGATNADTLPYFPVSDEIASAIASWVGSHLDVTEFALGAWDNTNKKLTVKSIKEDDGKIAVGTDTTTPKILEVTFAEGTKIDLSSTNNTLTITHESTTRSDTTNTTDINGGDAVVTSVTTDATGHVTGITTYKFPAYTTIAPVQSVASGNHITVNTSNNVATVNHDAVGSGSAVTPTSGTAPDWEGDVITGISIDDYGHVAGATKGALPSNPVSAASGTTNQIMVSDGDNTTSNSGKTITTSAPSNSSDDTTLPTSKAVNDSIDTKINALDSSVSAGSGKVLTGVTEADGKLTAKTDVDYTTIAPVQSVAGDNKWTSVSTSSNTATVSHIGPDTSSTSSATATAGTAPGFGGNVLTGVTIDGKGHVTGVTTGALPSNPVSGLEGTASDTASGITVQVDSTGGEVDNVDVTVALDTLKSALGLTGALIPKGTLGTGGTITTLPTASASNLGWAYKVITDGTYSGISAKVGDVIYCILNNDGETYSWTLIPSGDESFTDTWRNVMVNGTQVLGNGISSGALKLVDGSHASVVWTGTNNANTIQIDVDEASTSQKGVVELTDSYNSTDDTEAATGMSIKAAIDGLDVNSDKGAASISGSTLTIKAVQQEDGKIKDGGTTTINLEGTYDASTNKIATQSTVSNAIEALDGIATIPDTGTSVNVITEVSETDGILSSKQKTITEGSKIDVTGASGSITIAHESITTTPTDNSVDPPNGLGDGERESYVITDVTTDGYGHITAYTKDKSTNLIAADIKAPVKRDNNNMFTFRETGDPVSISEDAAKIKVVKGNTLKWNQKLNIHTSDGITQSCLGSVSLSITDVNVFNASGTVTGNVGITWPVAGFPELVGHKVLVYFKPFAPTDGFAFGFYAAEPDYKPNIYVVSSNYSLYFNVYAERFSQGQSVDMHKVVNVIDLTLMFGAGNEPSTVEEFEKLFPAPYYPYCESRLINLGGYHVKLNQQLKYSYSASELTIYSLNGSDCGCINTLFPKGKYIFTAYYIKSTNSTGLYYGDSTHRVALWDDIDRPSGNVEWYIDSSFDFYLGGHYSGSPSTAQVKLFWDSFSNMQLINLTEMFGSGSEPSTVEEVEAILSLIKAQKGITDDYIPYTEGEDMNPVSELGIESTGFNLFDEEWDEGYIDPDTGEELASGGQYRSRDFIQVLPNTLYYIFLTGNYPEQPLRCRYYDKSKNYLGYSGQATVGNETFGTPENCYYLKICLYTGGGYPQKGSVCINKSDTKRNGTYELYRKDTLDLSFIKDLGIPNFNIWDEEWENGVWQTDKTNYYTSGYIMSKNILKAPAGQTIYIKAPVGVNAIVWDIDGNALVAGGIGANTTYEFPENAYEWVFYLELTTYNHDICINKSVPGINGTYLPHGEKYYYFPYGLQNAGDAFDEVHETYAIKRIGFVDLGTLSWRKQEVVTGVYSYVDTTIPGAARNAAILCSKYTTVGQGTTELGEQDKTISFNQNKACRIFDSTYNNSSTTETEFKAAMEGIPLIYELEEPVRIDFDTPVNLNYAVDDKGTEALLPQNTSNAVVTAPFAGTITYMSNFKEGVLDLMGRFNDFTPTTEIIPGSATANRTLPTSQAVIDYMRAGGNGVKPVYESGDEVTPTTDVHAGLKTEVGNNSYKYYKVPFSAVTNDPSTGTSQVQIILNGNFS